MDSEKEQTAEAVETTSEKEQAEDTWVNTEKEVPADAAGGKDTEEDDKTDVREDVTETTDTYREDTDVQPEEQFQRAESYYYGKGVAQNYETAAEWYRKAAEQGYACAQFALGRCYYNGEGVKKDRKTGVEWLTKAADHGNQDARQMLEEFKSQRRWFKF